MVRKIHVQNFKSLSNFQLELGCVNVLIGANGSGKTNLLEGIALGAASAAGTLDNFSLKDRIRLVAPEYMRSAFGNQQMKEILIDITADAPQDSYAFELSHDGKERWRNRMLSSASFASEYSETSARSRRSRMFTSDLLQEEATGTGRDDTPFQAEEPRVLYRGNPEKGTDYQQRLAQFGILSDYWIFAPDARSMRLPEDRYQRDPLGAHGEGLFRELRRIVADEACREQKEEIEEHLGLFDWFVGMKLQKRGKFQGENVVFRDRFMGGRLAYVDQNSIDDGFLYLLFYLVLLTSEDTPRFFAVENIDAAFNPRICWEVMAIFGQLAKKHGKQMVVTTHNSSILNGLDLKDDEQRLFVVSRNSKGHTRAQRIAAKPQGGTLLSEIWTKGYIGGMPDNL